MRFFAVTLPVLLLSTCAPFSSPEPPPEPLVPTPPPPGSFALPVSGKPVEASVPVSNIPITAPRTLSKSIAGIQFEGVSFDSRGHRLVVADQAGGPGSQWADAQSAARSRQGIAAINAGFFTPEGAPLGKVIASGASVGSWNRASSLGSGVFYETPSDSLALARRERVSASASYRELLQSGPFLVENSRAIHGLDSIKSSLRTLILWDGGTRWWIGRTSPCSLAKLGETLAAESPSGFPVRHALNLDGGRSSDLFVSSSVPGGPLVRRTAWNRPVRNFLVLVPR